MVRKNAAAKRAARARSRAENIPYTVARRRAAEEAHEPEPPVIARPRHIDDLLHEFVDTWCSQQLGEPVDENLWPDPDTVAVLGIDIADPTVHELIADRRQTYSTLVEELEGGTVLSMVTATARLTVDGLLDRGEAAGADGSLVDVLGTDWNDHFSAVVARTAVEVELRFSAVTNPDFENVEDVAFTSATVLGLAAQ